MTSSVLSLILRITPDASKVPAGTKAAETALNKMQGRIAKMHAARDILGVRSERTIQREIKQTEAAYNRLARSGTASARELTRAYDAQRAKIRELRQEMQGVTKLQKSLNVGRGVATIGAGVAAGAYVMSQPIAKTMDFDRRLAMSANTLFTERKDVAGRIAGAKEIGEAVATALQQGGGDRDSALEALNRLYSSGALGDDEIGRRAAFALLPTIQKYQTGTGANSADLADISSKAKAGFQIDAKNMPYVLDMAIAGGDAGGMELKDQAKFLPSQMSSASNLGMRGEADFAALVAANQAAFLGAGTTDEAGNNLKNLLNKFSSADTQKDFAKFGINVTDEMTKGRANGLNAIDVIMQITDRVVAKDKRYQAIQSQLSKTTDKDERRALIESQASIIEGSSLGKVMADQQASAALSAIMSNRDFYRSVAEKARNAQGAGEINFQGIAATSSFQVERLKNEKEMKEHDAFSGLSNVVGDAAGKLADYSQKYPGLSTAIVGATTGLTALTTAAGAAGAASILTGGTAGTAGRAALGTVSKAFPLIAAGAAGYGIGTWINQKMGELTGGGEGWAGEWLYNKIHGKELAELNQPIQSKKLDMSGKIAVTVDVKNNTASASVSMSDRDLDQRFKTGRTMPAVSGGIRG